MHFLISAVLLVASVSVVLASSPATAPPVPIIHTDSAKTSLKSGSDLPTNSTIVPKRVVRQILGYGGVGSNIVSGVGGISSGYGYGYNNAVNVNGMGSQQGSQLGLPLGLGFGRR